MLENVIVHMCPFKYTGWLISMDIVSHFPQNEIFNVYFLNNTSIFNNLIKKLFEVVTTFLLHTDLQMLRQ